REFRLCEGFNRNSINQIERKLLVSKRVTTFAFTLTEKVSLYNLSRAYQIYMNWKICLNKKAIILSSKTLKPFKFAF
ncbi:hypothetical protein BpHYR1_036860, partial [Brachionus plicatilis]